MPTTPDRRFQEALREHLASSIDRTASTQSRTMSRRRWLAEDPAAKRPSSIARGTGPHRARAALVTAAVLLAVVGVSTAAINFGSQHRASAPAGGAATSAGTQSSTQPTEKLLATFTSSDGAIQQHVIHPNGLATKARFDCTGSGAYALSIAGGGGSSGDSGCRVLGYYSSGRGLSGSVQVNIRTDSRMTWTLTIVGVQPDQETATSTTPATSARPCTTTDLSARFESATMPKEVTEAAGGQIALTNTSKHVCTLTGYPLVRFTTAGTPLGHHTMASSHKRSTDVRVRTKGLIPAVLQPGGTAYTQIDWYLPNYYPANNQGACVAREVANLRIDLDNALASSAQSGALTMPLGATVTACLNGPWGVNGKYGQISASTFVEYSLNGKY